MDSLLEKYLIPLYIVSDAPRDPKPTQTITAVLACPPELGDVTAPLLTNS